MRVRMFHFFGFVGALQATPLLVLLIMAGIAFAQNAKTVAVLPSDGVLSPEELEALTDRARGAALRVMPPEGFSLLKQDVIVKRLGGMEEYVRKCTENSCVLNLGKQAQVDYVAQATVGRLGDKLRLKVELYNVSTEALIDLIDEDFDNFEALRHSIDEKAPEMFRKIPGVVPSVYAVDFISEPPGAAMAFNGAPYEKCLNAPCKIELGKGLYNVSAAMDGYEHRDTAAFVQEGSLSFFIRLERIEEEREYVYADNRIDPQVNPDYGVPSWVPIAMETSGALFIIFGISSDSDVSKAHKDYKAASTQKEMDSAWKKVEDARGSRNMFYTFGALLLAAGAGVHLWF